MPGATGRLGPLAARAGPGTDPGSALFRRSRGYAGPHRRVDRHNIKTGAVGPAPGGQCPVRPPDLPFAAGARAGCRPGGACFRRCWGYAGPPRRVGRH